MRQKFLPSVVLAMIDHEGKTVREPVLATGSAILDPISVRQLANFGPGPHQCGSNSIRIERQEIDAPNGAGKLNQYRVTCEGGPIFKSDPGSMPMPFNEACRVLRVKAVKFTVPLDESGEEPPLGGLESFNAEFEPYTLEEGDEPVKIILVCSEQGGNCGDLELRLVTGQDYWPFIKEPELIHLMDQGPAMFETAEFEVKLVSREPIKAKGKLQLERVVLRLIGRKNSRFGQGKIIRGCKPEDFVLDSFPAAEITYVVDTSGKYRHEQDSAQMDAISRLNRKFVGLESVPADETSLTANQPAE